MALPPTRSERARTMWPPASTATSVVPPPTSTITAPAPGARSSPAPAAAATGLSMNCRTLRGRAAAMTAARDRRSSGVAPPGTQMTASGRANPRGRRAWRRNACSMATAASKSATAPSRTGWMISISRGSFSARASAARPTASIVPACRCTAIADGSSTTKPPTLTSVFTVPRSTATPGRDLMTLPALLPGSDAPCLRRPHDQTAGPQAAARSLPAPAAAGRPDARYLAPRGTCQPGGVIAAEM